MQMRAWPLVAVLAALGCGGAVGELEALTPEAPAAPEALAAIHAGEKMRFEVRVAGILAGEASFTTVEVDDTTALLASTIRSAGALALVKDVRDDATTRLELAALRPLVTTSAVRANPRDYDAETRFADGKVTIDFRPLKGDPQHLVYDFGTDVAHDAHSAMATMRVWQAPPGTRRTLWVLGGRRIWKVEVTMGPTEVLSVYGGNQQVVRIDGLATRAFANRTLDTKRKPRTFTVWMSDDADRVPFRVSAGTELGDVVIDLVDYVRP